MSLTRLTYDAMRDLVDTANAIIAVEQMYEEKPKALTLRLLANQLGRTSYQWCQPELEATAIEITKAARPGSDGGHELAALIRRLRLDLYRMHSVNPALWPNDEPAPTLDTRSMADELHKSLSCGEIGRAVDLAARLRDALQKDDIPF